METTDTPKKIIIQAGSLVRPFDDFARRMLDILAALFGLLALSPLFVVIMLAILRDSPGPVFYRGPRIGKHGKRFGILKFRTMYEKPDSYDGPRITGSGDARITPLGRWLRDTKINELPQLWNVLVGDMSLVGPRPEDPEIAMGWPAHLREELLAVRPGITSPATVVFRSEEEMLHSANVMDDYLRTILPDKLRLDLIYVRNRSLLTDMDIIFMTMLLLLPRLRKSQVPEAMLYWGPLARFVSRYLNWFLLDTLVALASISVSAVLWRLEAPMQIGLNRWVGIALIVGLCFSVTNALLGLTRIQWRRAPDANIIPLGVSAGVSTLILILFDLIVFHHGQLHTKNPHLPLGVVVITGMLSFFGFAAMRYRERLLTGFATQWLKTRRTSRAVGERVLLIGAGNNSQLATWLLTRSDFARLFTIVGIVDDDPRKQGLLIDGFEVVGTTGNIATLVKKYDIGLAIFTISNIEEAERQRILKACRAAYVRVLILPDVMAELNAQFQNAAIFTVGD